MNGEHAALNAERLLDRYQVESVLGVGGFGSVVKAYDTRLKRTVAIKTLRRTLAHDDPHQFHLLRERFAREAEAGSRMPVHPNLVAVFDLVIDTDQSQYLILEFIPGGTLAQRLGDGPLPLHTVLRVGADIANGLLMAHEAGIVHRDIKPANIFLAEGMHAKIGDFGIAQIDNVSGRTHGIIGHPGTPLYMSPEQARMTGYVRPASDQYSLGLVLFEMLTAEAYKRVGDRTATTLLAALPDDVAGLVERLLSEHPDDRFPSMQVVVRAIRTIERTRETAETLIRPNEQRGASHLILASESAGIAQEENESGGKGARDAPMTEIDTVKDAPTVRDAPAMAVDAMVPEQQPMISGDMPHDSTPTDAANETVIPASLPRRIAGSHTVRYALIPLLIAVVVVGVYLAARSSGTVGIATATPQQRAAGSLPTPPPFTSIIAATVAPASVGETSLAPTFTATSAITATPAPLPTPTTVPPTATPIPTPTSVPPTPTPVPGIGVFGAGTTNDGTLQAVTASDVVTTFLSGEEVFAFVNYGGAQPNLDAFDLTAVANGAAQPPIHMIVPSKEGFALVSLGKLPIANYTLEVRYKGALVKQADFRVAPRPTPVPPTPVPRVVQQPAQPAFPTATRASGVQPTPVNVVVPATTAPQPQPVPVVVQPDPIIVAPSR